MSTSPITPATTAAAAHPKRDASPFPTTAAALKLDALKDVALKDAPRADFPTEAALEVKEPAQEAEQKSASPKATVKVESPEPEANKAESPEPDADEPQDDDADVKPKAASQKPDASPKPKAQLKASSSTVKQEPTSEDETPKDPPKEPLKFKSPKKSAAKPAASKSYSKTKKAKPAAAAAVAAAASPARKKQKMYTPLLPQTAFRTRVYQSSSSPKDEGAATTKLNFAQRLMELLEKDDVQPCLHWMEDGKSICIEDSVKFANEVMPKYFSDTKYKSFMVRMKRWGFKTTTPKDVQGAKIMECELFRRDQPELCLLMGDERRVDRINVAKDITKRAEKREEEAAAAAAAASTAPSSVPSAGVTAQPSTEAQVAAAVRQSQEASQRLAIFEHQRNVHDLNAISMLTGRYPGDSMALNRAYPGMYPSMAVSSASILPQSSTLLGMGSDPLLGLRGYESLGMHENLNNLSLHEVEEEIRRCLDTIQRCQETMAVTRQRLNLFQSVREARLMRGSARGLALLSEHCHP